MKYVFLDSNIWLSVYHFTKDDLEQFKKLEEQLDKEISLIVTKQVVDEVRRNRENKLEDSLRSFVFPEIKFPAFCKNYDEYDSFHKQYQNLKKEFDNWFKVIKDDISNNNSPADNVIEDLFDSVSIALYDTEIIDKAKVRFDLGNPPGKKKSYGDSINWEILLRLVPKGEDLYFLSNDSDYCSKLDNTKFHPYLLGEWCTKKNSDIFFYKSLYEFLKDHFHEIELKSERIKEELIVGLRNSPNFSTTHSLISQLNEYTDWTDEQISRLCAAGIKNSQVSRILSDTDILHFYHSLLRNYDVESSMDDSIIEISEIIDNIIDDIRSNYD